MSSRCAVMGNPVAHSLSPFIHQYFAEQTGKQLSYEKILVAEDTFESQVTFFFAQGGLGLNITLPFKQRAFAMADLSTPRCQQAKAANTLWMEEERLHADNTDGAGLIKDLSRYLDLNAKKILLIGAGGAARGIIAPLLAANIARLTVTNRTEEKATILQTDFPEISYCPLTKLQAEYDVLINATSASLTGDAIPLAPALFQAATCCYDLAYSATGETAFVAWARAQGCRQAVDGLGMLVEQAAESFFIWHGIRPDTRPVLTALKAKQKT
ncbi:TPA: shikimate dehydrogenase [Legionella feeleii]